MKTSLRQSPPRREYVMRTRAASVEATRARVVDAALALFMAVPYDEVTLDSIALRAGVSLPTVLRQFGSKEDLIVACAHAKGQRERALRKVEPGNIPAVARTLAARYEEDGKSWRRIL